MLMKLRNKTVRKTVSLFICGDGGIEFNYSIAISLVVTAELVI
jgi:hypothetical protein